jgi:hypothetical protein
MSRADWISLISAVATVLATVVSAIAVLTSTKQFKLSAKQSRDDRQADATQRLVDASAARQIIFDDATEARQLRQEEARNDREIRLEEARKRWLTSVIIQPSLPVINGFYFNIISAATTALDELIDLSTIHAASSPEMRNARLSKMGGINNLKQDFDHSFIVLVATQNRRFGQKLREALNELEDMVAEPLGKVDYSQVDKVLLSEQLYAHKSKFFSILFQEVQQESQ